MLRGPTSNAMLVPYGLMYLLPEPALLILSVLSHVHFAVLLGQTGRVIELGGLARGSVLALGL